MKNLGSVYLLEFLFGISGSKGCFFFFGENDFSRVGFVGKIE